MLAFRGASTHDIMPSVTALSWTLPFIDGACSVSGGALINATGKLAGSVGTLRDGIRYLVRAVGVPLDEALRLASLYPAYALSLAGVGSLAPGNFADYVLFDNQLNVLRATRGDGI